MIIITFEAERKPIYFWWVPNVTYARFSSKPWLWLFSLNRKGPNVTYARFSSKLWIWSEDWNSHWWSGQWDSWPGRCGLRFGHIDVQYVVWSLLWPLAFLWLTEQQRFTHNVTFTSTHNRDILNYLRRHSCGQVHCCYMMHFMSDFRYLGVMQRQKLPFCHSIHLATLLCHCQGKGRGWECGKRKGLGMWARTRHFFCTCVHNQNTCR